MSQAETRRRRIPRWLLWPLIGAAVLIAPGVLAILYTEYRFAQKVADLRAQGYPTSFEELQAYYDRQKPPPDEDGTELWIEAAKEFESAYDRLEHSQTNWSEVSSVTATALTGIGALSYEDIPLITEYIELRKAGIDLCRQLAADGKKLHWPLHLTDDRLLTNEFVLITTFASDAPATAAMLLALGREDEALEFLDSLAKCTALTTPNPTFLGTLLSEILDRNQLKVYERYCEGNHPSPEQLSEWQRILEVTDHTNSCRARLIDRLVTEIELFRSDTVQRLLVGCDVLNLIEWSLQRVDLPYDEINPGHRLFADKIKDRHRFSAQFLPEFAPDVYFGIITESVAYARCAIIGLAVRRFSLKYDRLPDSLDELFPEFLDQILMDPFTDKPLRYLRLDDRVVVSSAAHDKRFDPYQIYDYDSDDLHFTFRWPPVERLPLTEKPAESTPADD